MTGSALELLDSAEVKFIRILWCDNANIIRAKAVHRDRIEEYLKHGVGISAAQQGVPVMYDAPAPDSGLGPVGEIRLVPDLSTVTVLPYSPGHARVMGNMVKNGAPWPLCPRNFLRRMISKASEADIEVVAAFENEFYLLEPPEQGSVPKPADSTLFASTLSMDLQQPVIDAVTEALIAQGVGVEQYYPESGPGQQEISILRSHALEAADRQIAFRETVRAVARQHRLIASFVPKIFPDQAGSGCHLHLSLWRNGQNLMPHSDGSGQPSLLARSFMAGILHHLPALMALTTPSTNSYRRIRPHCWSGAFQCWGFDNREAAIRVPTQPEGPSPTQIELKTVDASSNPHLALGSAIAAGMDGIERDLKLAAEVDVDPGAIPEPERISRSIRPLPTLLGESIRELERDDVLLDALGPELARAFTAVRRMEWEAMKDWTAEMEVRLLLERY
jgi:glutamine synthetase